MLVEAKKGGIRDELAERVKHSIHGLGYHQLESVECNAHASTIHLSGRLNSYYLKQIAQTVAIKVPGVNQVVNEIQVEK